MLSSRAVRFLALELVLCLILLAFWWRLGLDDSYIFLTYARNFAKSGIFAYNPGEPSYGFSSPAWVIILAAVSRVTMIPVGVFLSNLLGVIMCGLSALAAWSIWGETEQQPSSKGLLFASLLFSGPWFFTIWFIFGMETGFAVFSIFGFLLWLVKLRAGATRFPWLILGALSATALALTRLESSIYIGCAIVFTLMTTRSKRQVADLLIVGVFAGGAEVAWLLYAHRLFGTYMPWTSTARIIYYLPYSFAGMTGDEFHHLSVGGHIMLALKAFFHIMFGGPMKFLLVVFPACVALYLMRLKEKPASLRSMLAIATLGMALELGLFTFLFPLAQNRHLIPYIAGIWVLAAPALAAMVERMAMPIRAAAFGAVVVLWVGGAALYRQEGVSLEPLHQIAASGYLTANDQVGAEPIGIIAFETPAHIIDLGGLTDRDAWPLLMTTKKLTITDVVTWDLGKGATKLILGKQDCLPSDHIYGNYCVADAQRARELARSARGVPMSPNSSAP